MFSGTAVILPNIFAEEGDKSSMDDGIWIAHHKSNSHPIIWTDKAHYNIGDTVKVSGKFGPDFTKSVSKGDWIAGDMILLIPNKNSSYDEKIIEKNIPVNKDRTFSTSFKLTSDMSSDFEGVEDTMTLRTGKIPWKYLIKIGNEDVPFFVGNTNHKIDPFDVWVKSGDLYSFKVGITTDSEDYTVAVRNKVPITRIMLPSGMTMQYSGAIGQSENGGDFKTTVAGYGKYGIEITFAGNSDIEFFDHKKPNPAHSKISLTPSENIVKSQLIRMYFEINSIDPEKRNFSFRINDPNDRLIDSGTGILSLPEGWYNSGGRSTGYIDIDTNNFPDIDGEYTITATYENEVATKEFNFKAFSSEFNLIWINHELDLLMNNSELYLPQFFGDEFTEKFLSASKSDDVSLTVKYHIELANKRLEKLDELQKEYENDIETWEITTDEKVDIIFDLRNKIESLREGLPKSIAQWESHLQQHYRTLESQEQNRINQEKETARVEEEINDEKEKIREELGLSSDDSKTDENNSKKLSTTNLASFVDPKKDPNHYLDRYNNEPTYKKWFDENYPDYTIHEAVGLSEPDSGKIPVWIKNNAKWWSDGEIEDDTFVSGIQYLMKEKIVDIPDLPEQVSEKARPNFVDETKDPQSYVDRYNKEDSYKKWFDENYPDYTIEEAVGVTAPIPTWIKNTATWWSEGMITEEEFIKGIEFLVEKRILNVN
jgi:hypothetical protein